MCVHLIRSDPQFQAVYDAVLVQAVIFMIYVAVHDSWITGRPRLDVGLLLSVVGALPLALLCCCIPCFSYIVSLHSVCGGGGTLLFPLSPGYGAINEHLLGLSDCSTFLCVPAMWLSPVWLCSGRCSLCVSLTLLLSLLVLSRFVY